MKTKINKTLFTNTLKGSLIAVAFSLILILIFAFILQILSLGDGTIKVVNLIIKLISIMLGTSVAVRKTKEKGLLTGLFVGLVYTVIAFIVFSILNGQFSFEKSLFNDILFGTIGGAICGVISVNTKSKKTAS